jgi:hypothetical protein
LLQSLVRIVLAEEAIKVAAVEEYCQVAVSCFWSLLVGVSWVSYACARWTEPGGATVGDMRIKIV